MRRLLPVFVALLAGLVLGALFSPIRYTFLENRLVVFRCDRLTGRVDIAVATASAPWRTIPKRLEDMSDKELTDLAKQEKLTK